MNIKKQWLAVLLFLLVIFLLIASIFLLLSLRASNKTLNQLNLINPGIHVSKVEEKLGKPMAIRDANGDFGTLKDDIVVYTTWNSL